MLLILCFCSSTNELILCLIVRYLMQLLTQDVGSYGSPNTGNTVLNGVV